MGNCLRKCFGRFDRRRQFLHTRYSVEKEASIEFANLMDEDDVKNEMSKLVTEREKQLLMTKQYNTLVTEQQMCDAEVDEKLQEDEEELRREEEAYIQAKQEAARIAKLQQQQEEAAKQNNGPKSWSAGQDGDWEVAGGEDDFEMFLETVRERSLKATAHLRKESSPGGQSSNSSSTPTPGNRERSHTDGSNSIDLEWDHDEDTGIKPVTRERTKSEEDLMNLAQQNHRESPSSATGSVDLEWDTEFISADDKDTRNLLAGGSHLTKIPT